MITCLFESVPVMAIAPPSLLFEVMRVLLIVKLFMVTAASFE